MAFLDYEQSQRDGRPVELFLFQNDVSATGIGYTNNLEAITVGVQGYEAINIFRTEPEYSDEADKSSIEIVVPKSNTFAQRYVIIAPGDRYTVSVYRKHVDQNSPEVSLFWRGYIAQVTFEGNQARILCRSLLELTTRQTPRMTFQQPCNHVLYDERCTVLEAAYRTVRVPDSVSADGVTLTFTNVNTLSPVIGAPSGYQGNFWVGGYIVTPDNIDYRLIIAQSGASTLQIQYPFLDSPAGKSLNIFAGCDHQPATCRDKFSNIINFGGHPYLPERNPFTKGL